MAIKVIVINSFSYTKLCVILTVDLVWMYKFTDSEKLAQRRC